LGGPHLECRVGDHRSGGDDREADADRQPPLDDAQGAPGADLRRQAVDLREGRGREAGGLGAHAATPNARPTDSAMSDPSGFTADGSADLPSRSPASASPNVTGRRLALARYWPNPGRCAPPPVRTATSMPAPGLLPE